MVEDERCDVIVRTDLIVSSIVLSLFDFGFGVASLHVWLDNPVLNCGLSDLLPLGQWVFGTGIGYILSFTFLFTTATVYGIALRRKSYYTFFRVMLRLF